MSDRAGSSQDSQRFMGEAVSGRDLAFHIQDDTHRTSVTKIRIVPGQTRKVRELSAAGLPATQFIPGWARQDLADSFLVTTLHQQESKSSGWHRYVWTLTHPRISVPVRSATSTRARS
jgi:hypothetical protein